MQKRSAISVFQSLASDTRLEIYRLLVRNGPHGLVAGKIGKALRLGPTNLSFHLKAMTQAGLLSVEQQGRFQRYRARVSLVEELIGYLTEQCCGGKPEKCLAPAPVKRVSRPKIRVKSV